MTWQELADYIGGMSNEDVNETVVLYDQDKGEFFRCDLIEFTEPDDIIESGQTFLSFSSEGF